MKAVILAAGRGTRISRYLSGNAKCTVDIGETCLIQYTVEMLFKKGIHDIAIVLGYQRESVREKLAGYGIVFYENPFFDVTNSIASLWFAKDFLRGDDLLIMNGDVFLEEALLEQILTENDRSPLLFADETRKEEADYKLYYENGLLKKYGKELRLPDITGEYIGIARLCKTHVPLFLERLEELIQQQQHGLWWENVLYSLSDHTDIYVSDIGGRFWAEVDYIEDYERILAYRGYQITYHINVSGIVKK